LMRVKTIPSKVPDALRRLKRALTPLSKLSPRVRIWLQPGLQDLGAPVPSLVVKKELSALVKFLASIPTKSPRHSSSARRTRSWRGLLRMVIAIVKRILMLSRLRKRNPKAGASAPRDAREPKPAPEVTATDRSDLAVGPPAPFPISTQSCVSAMEEPGLIAIVPRDTTLFPEDAMALLGLIVGNTTTGTELTAGFAEVTRARRPSTFFAHMVLELAGGKQPTVEIGTDNSAPRTLKSCLEAVTLLASLTFFAGK